MLFYVFIILNKNKVESEINIPEKCEKADARVIIRQLVERPVTQKVDGAQEADVVGLAVLLDVHEDVDEVLAAHCQQLHVRLTRHGGTPPRAVHQRQLLWCHVCKW